MKNLFFLLSLGLPMLVMGRLSSSEIEFQNGANHFQVLKSEVKFSFRDHLGTRTLEIKDCNEKIIDQFWSDLVRNAENVKSPAPAKKSNLAWVQYDKIKSKILPSEAAYVFFNKVIQNSRFVFSESKKLCKEK